MSFPDPPPTFSLRKSRRAMEKWAGAWVQGYLFTSLSYGSSWILPWDLLCICVQLPNNCVCNNVLSCLSMGFNYTPGVCNQPLWECPYPPQLCSGAGRETSSQQGNSLNRHMHLPHWILQRLLSISTPGGESFDYPTGGMWAAWRSILCVHCMCVVLSTVYVFILLQKAMKPPKTPRTPASVKKGKENTATPSKVQLLLKKYTVTLVQY